MCFVKKRSSIQHILALKKKIVYSEKNLFLEKGNTIVFISDIKIHLPTYKSGERILSKAKEWTNKNSLSFLEMSHKRKHQFVLFFSKKGFQKW